MNVILVGTTILIRPEAFLKAVSPIETTDLHIQTLSGGHKIKERFIK